MSSSLIDTTAAQLAALRAQAERLPAWMQALAALAVSIVDSYLATRERIRGERYAPERASEENAASKATTVGAFVTVLNDAHRAAADALERAIRDHDKEQAGRRREARKLTDVIDVPQLRASDDVNEIRRGGSCAKPRATVLAGKQRGLRCRAFAHWPRLNNVGTCRAVARLVCSAN